MAASDPANVRRDFSAGNLGSAACCSPGALVTPASSSAAIDDLPEEWVDARTVFTNGPVNAVVYDKNSEHYISADPNFNQENLANYTLRTNGGRVRGTYNERWAARPASRVTSLEVVPAGPWSGLMVGTDVGMQYGPGTFRRLGEPSGSSNSDLFAAIPPQP